MALLSLISLSTTELECKQKQHRGRIDPNADGLSRCTRAKEVGEDVGLASNVSCANGEVVAEGQVV